MITRKYNGLCWHEFELLADCAVIHASFTKRGGFSTGDLESLNLGRSVGDTPENLHANFQKVSDALSLEKIISARLCHGDSVTAWNDPENHMVPISDGLSTNVSGMSLMVTHADCQAALFYDPIHHAISNVHCGWRGNVQNIYANTVAHMQQVYGSKPQNLLVCISPSLGPKSAEFMHYKTELPKSFWNYQIRPFYFDLWEISKAQLINTGVLAHHIEIACIDTYASDDYFSYRRSNKCGRQATICALS